MSPIRLLSASILILAPFLGSGCASTTINVASWQPASADISGLRRIAVTRFEGPEQLTEELQREISNALSLSGAYQLCDPTPIQVAMNPWKSRSPEDIYAALDAARRQGIDSILIGKAHRKADYGMELGGMYVRMGDPELTASLSYELVDVRTGDVRARRSLNQRFNDEVSTSSRDANSEERVLAHLTNKCIQELVAEVAPHERKTKVKLAGGGFGIASGNLRKGNTAAAKSDWAMAQQEWETVLRANPDSHAARHNLGVAAEVAGDLQAADVAYREAERRAQKDLYRDALARVEQAAEGQQLVFAQRSGGYQMAARPGPPTGPQPAGWNQPPAVPTTTPPPVQPVYQPMR
jgi:tetratricopeptide (TPR) repeat protein